MIERFHVFIMEMQGNVMFKVGVKYLSQCFAVHAGFRSEAKVVTKNDMRSTSSLSYDDIDEKAETLPLTSEAATNVASGDKYVHEGAIPQSLGKFNHSFFML